MLIILYLVIIIISCLVGFGFVYWLLEKCLIK